VVGIGGSVNHTYLVKMQQNQGAFGRPFLLVILYKTLDSSMDPSYNASVGFAE